MQANHVTKDVQAIAMSIGKNLRSQGITVAHSQVLKAVSASLGQTDWQKLRSRASERPTTDSKLSVKVVGAGGSGLSALDDEPPAMKLGQAPLTREQLNATNGTVRLVVPLLRAIARDGSIDLIRNTISKTVTGDPAGLKDIVFTGDAASYGEDHIGLLITAFVSDAEFSVQPVPAATEEDRCNPEHRAFYTERSIQAKFQRQVWINDYAVDTAPIEDVDVTKEALRLSLEKLREMEDDQYVSDELVNLEALGHDGPFYVQAQEALCQFFDVENLSTINQEMLDAARAAHGVTSFYA